ncbi:hypothetical protein EDEG_02914, partial [Edhazardia aedis USNM 41457]
MTHYNYKEREQKPERLYLGKLEKHKEAVSRLRETGRIKRETKKLKRIVMSQTGKEFFFKMQNARKRENEIIKLDKSLIDNPKWNQIKKKQKATSMLLTTEEKLALNNIDSEICVIKKKMENILLKPITNRIVYDEDGNAITANVDDNIIDFDKNESVHRKYKEYYDNLCKLKLQIKNRETFEYMESE